MRCFKTVSLRLRLRYIGGWGDLSVCGWRGGNRLEAPFACACGGGGSSIIARTEGRHHMQMSARSQRMHANVSGKVDGFVRPPPLIFRNRSDSISSLGWHFTRVAIAIRWDKCNGDCLQSKVRE